MSFIRLEPRGQASKTMVYVTPLLAVVLTLLSGFILFMAMGFDPLKALHAFFVAPLTSVRGVGELVVKATQTGARITIIEDAPLLAAVGGVGALLRFKL